MKTARGTTWRRRTAERVVRQAINGRELERQFHAAQREGLLRLLDAKLACGLAVNLQMIHNGVEGRRRLDEEAMVLERYRRISGSTATPLLKFRSVVGSHLLFKAAEGGYG